jgi:hypothetical protein
VASIASIAAIGIGIGSFAVIIAAIGIGIAIAAIVAIMVGVWQLMPKGVPSDDQLVSEVPNRR